jgi:hypothetical protein
MSDREEGNVIGRHCTTKTAADATAIIRGRLQESLGEFGLGRAVQKGPCGIYAPAFIAHLSKSAIIAGVPE